MIDGKKLVGEACDRAANQLWREVCKNAFDLEANPLAPNSHAAQVILAEFSFVAGLVEALEKIKEIGPPENTCAMCRSRQYRAGEIASQALDFLERTPWAFDVTSRIMLSVILSADFSGLWEI